MLTLATLADAINKIENAIRHSDEQKYTDISSRLWGQRSAFNMAATYLIPDTHDETLFLHELIDEYTEFVGDEPTCEGERENAIAAILRMNETLRG
ncbi:MAG: hypothetical protein PSV22_25345 [Pseudolabrys sp.]|nr:hypothetical protein [Pseudolabrys sp.]